MIPQKYFSEVSNLSSQAQWLLVGVTLMIFIVALLMGATLTATCYQYNLCPPPIITPTRL